MSTWRNEGETCPVTEEPLGFDACRACRFFRGASRPPRSEGWKILCNWPRHGSEIVREPVPRVFREGMG